MELLLVASFLFPPPDREVPPHPRLMATPPTLEALLEDVDRGEIPDLLVTNVLSRANQYLSAPPITYSKSSRDNLYGPSREAGLRIWSLGMAWWLTGSAKYREAAVTIMRDIAAFPDWNPSHFLDTGMFSLALGLGYDWFYDDLSLDERELIREALVEKGLKPGLEALKGKMTGWWRYANNNWNLVCNGGLIVASLALWDEEEKLAYEVLSRSVESLQKPLDHWPDDGGWLEGPGYWDYGTEFLIYALDSLSSVFGDDGGLSASLGFSRTGNYRMQVVGPSGKPFNYGDSTDLLRESPHIAWLSRRFHRPDWSSWHRNHLSYLPQDLLWYVPEEEGVESESPPLTALFPETGIAFLRSSWDENAFFVGIKGGQNGVSHGHLDLGSFVLDWEGERWITELGRDSYSLPGYFGIRRNSYYRNNTFGHNTLLVDGLGQKRDGLAPLTHQENDLIIVNLSKAYSGFEELFREWSLGEGRVLVRTWGRSAHPSSAVIRLHTPAHVLRIPTGIQLSLGENRLCLAGGSQPLPPWTLSPAAPPTERENPNEGITRIDFNTAFDPLGELLLSFSPC
ncbi:heparinase II/III family protein [bacterium]|nr:heparinase II/III family protein [bacterium]